MLSSVQSSEISTFWRFQTYNFCAPDFSKHTRKYHVEGPGDEATLLISWMLTTLVHGWAGAHYQTDSQTLRCLKWTFINRDELTTKHSELTTLASSFNCRVNNFDRLGYSLMSSIRASSMSHPNAHTYNPNTGLRHHLGNSLEVSLPQVRESKRDGSWRNRTSCKIQIYRIIYMYAPQ